MRTVEPYDEYVGANGLKLHYLEWGNKQGQPIVLLHGFLGHAHVWDRIAEAFSDRYRVLALDQRGHGESGWSQEAAYTIDDHFLDIDTFLTTLELSNVILIGHSMGGRNALFYTACKPSQVARLILVDARPDDTPQASQALKDLLLAFPLKASGLDEVEQALQGLYPYLSKQCCKQIARYGYKQEHDRIFIPSYDTRMSVQCERMNYVTEGLWPYLPNIPCSSLIIRGKESPFLSKEVAQRMCELIPVAVMREIPQATHMPAQENPVAFQRIVSEFLRNKL
jgi:pimeloyl-ACP methyl ester carboxylesterase